MARTSVNAGQGKQVSSRISEQDRRVLLSWRIFEMQVCEVCANIYLTVKKLNMWVYLSPVKNLNYTQGHYPHVHLESDHRDTLASDD